MTAPIADRFHAKWVPEPNTGCWLWTASCDGKGYPQISVYGQRSMARASRVSWELHRGPIPDAAPCVLHKCDTPACVNPDHLFLGTKKDNSRDMARKGRCSFQTSPLRGEVHPQAKLTDVHVAEIRAASLRGVRLAEKYGVSQTTISEIRRGLSRVSREDVIAELTKK